MIRDKFLLRRVLGVGRFFKLGTDAIGLYWPTSLIYFLAF